MARNEKVKKRKIDKKTALFYALGVIMALSMLLGSLASILPAAR